MIEIIDFWVDSKSKLTQIKYLRGKVFWDFINFM